MELKACYFSLIYNKRSNVCAGDQEGEAEMLKIEGM